MLPDALTTRYSLVFKVLSALNLSSWLWHTGSARWWWVLGLPAQQQQYIWQDEGSLWTYTSGGLSPRKTRHAPGSL